MILQSIKNKVNLNYAVLLLVSSGLFIGGWSANSKPHEWDGVMVRESDGIVLLFALPLLMQVGGLLYLCLKPVESKGSERFFNLYSITMFFCAFFNYVLWIYYLDVKYQGGADVQQWSHVALVCIIILLAFVVIVTFAFMTPHDGQPGKEHGGVFIGWVTNVLVEIKDGASRRPFWTLLHSMSVFLTVTFLFAFAFAFHDLTVPRLHKGEAQTVLPPLYMASLPNYSKLEHEGHDEPECFNFRFGDGSPALDAYDSYGEAAAVEKYSDGMNLGDKERQELLDRRKENWATMDRVVKKLVQIADMRRHSYVLLVGHADRKEVREGSPFKNNLELSRARAEDVMRQMKGAAFSKNHTHWINAEWNAIAWSNADSPRARDSVQKACGMSDPGTEGRAVEVFITPVLDHPFKFAMDRYRDSDFQRLDLLDHVYFATYTITTTGYGDIIPTTRYTKFLTCLANICEVFFIVGLFNSLMALKYNPDEGT
jgi:hypothetical protein